MKKGILIIIALITCCGILFGLYSFSAQKEADEKISEIIENHNEEAIYLITDDGEYIEDKNIVAYRMLMLSFDDENHVESAVFYLCYDRNGEPVYSEFINGLKAGVQPYSLKKDVFGNILLKANSNDYFYKKLKIETNESNKITGVYYSKKNWHFKLADKADKDDLIDNMIYWGEKY